MITIERTVSTTTDAETVSTYLADFTNAEEWDSGTKSCALISGDGGVGTRYRNVSTFAERTVELVYEVIDRTDDRLVIEGSNRTTTSRDTITTVAAGGGSDVIYRADFTLQGPARFLGPVMRILLNRLANRTAAQMKTVLDSLTARS